MSKTTARKQAKPLYRCPFCGGPASIWKDRTHGGWFAGCAHAHHADPDCCHIGPKSSLPGFISREAARRAWNKRSFPRPLTKDEIKKRKELEWHRRQMRDNPAYRQSVKEHRRERYNDRRRARRRKPVMIDLSDEIDTAFDPWTCPECKKTYDQSRVIYISPIDYKERCPACAEAPHPGEMLIQTNTVGIRG